MRSRTTQWLPSPVVVVRDAHVAMWCSRLNPCTHCFRKHASERPFFFYRFLLRSEHARNVSGVSAYDILVLWCFTRTDSNRPNVDSKKYERENKKTADSAGFRILVSTGVVLIKQ